MKPEESFIGQPIRALQTMLRAIAQFEEAQPNVIPDGVYGNQTAESVSAFQRNNGLPITGDADLDTWEAIVRAYRPLQTELAPAEPIYITLNPGKIFIRGDRHPHINLLQAMLINLGLEYDNFPRVTVTGIFDDPTADALVFFQDRSGLPATGNLDKSTWKHLVLQHALTTDRTNRKYEEIINSL